MKFLLTNQSVENHTISALPYEGMSLKSVGLWNLLLEGSEILKTSKEFFSITDGYLKNFNKNLEDIHGQTESALESIKNNWPPSENITGSFSSVIIDKLNDEVVVCNDAIGIYPLYVLKDGKKIYISNSIILLGIVSAAEFDKAGVFQRCVGPEYSNIGSRTILKNCKRLLPGEYSKYDHKGRKIKSVFDNTLFQDIKPLESCKNIHLDYWRLFKKEIDYCLSGTRDVNIALSGGLDSRIVLGAIPDNKHIKCITYGDQENYETIIASRLASIKDADFQSFSNYELHFPPLNVLRSHVIANESVNLGSWLEVLENIKVDGREPLLLGDMTEVLNARNIKKYSSKKFREQNFLNYYLFKKKYHFTKSSEERFESWKESILIQHARWYNENRFSQFDFTINPEEIKEALYSDLDEVFERIRAHKLPFKELYDELFSWLSHSRIPMGKQILICNSKFKSYSPPMSLAVMRMASKIHPGLRLGGRLMDKMYSEIEELRKLRIPTSQAPLIPQNYPNLLKYPMWGIRSKIDNYLINQMVKKKKVSGRYRLFKSMNWAAIYQNPEMEDHLRSYFNNNHLGNVVFQNILNQAVARKELIQWPFANMDILNISSLNLEMDIIKKNSLI
ncbi:MAG: hypothetical protein ABGW97_16740 [Christiangramia sp.]|uniref:hypothetical protein n=1 Tax=Christiangramia sp. TaxID=1931228 RepID=UPI003242170A